MTQEIIDDIVSYIEGRFPVGEPTEGYRSVTGEPYVTLTSGGIKEEGGAFKVWTADLLKAAELFLYEFERYAKDKSSLTHTMYWRRKPTVCTRTHVIEATPLNGGQRLTVTDSAISARFAITDKPPLSEAEFNQVIEAS